jgi:hypothetical protein
MRRLILFLFLPAPYLHELLDDARVAQLLKHPYFEPPKFQT